jgi:cob(I)alamin adenosyltransferase
MTDEEIDKKITTLQKIIFSNNFNLSMQARTILDTYRAEQINRINKKVDKYMKKKNIDLDKIIEIGSN